MIFALMYKVCLLIIIALVGYICSKRMGTGYADISSLLIYVISPIVIFVSIIESPSGPTCLFYTAYAFLFSSISALSAWCVGRLLWNDARANLFAFAGGTGNTGYFALPIVFTLFNPQQTALAIFIIIGVNLYEFTVGYFITATGKASARESIRKVMRMPVMFSAILALIVKIENIALSENLLSFLEDFKGAYTVLGMMIIGISLAKFEKPKIDYHFLLFTLLWKHVLLPVSGVFIFTVIFQIPPPELAVISLMLATPMAGNVVVLASQLNVYPERAALSVMLSTLLSLFFIPLIVWYVTNYVS